MHAAEVKRRCCHIYKDRLASADVVGKPACVSSWPGGLEVGFRKRKLLRGHVVDQNDPSGDLIGHLPQSR